MPASKFWNFKQQTKNAAELVLYGDISDTSWWGDEVTPKAFNDELKALGEEVEEITVRINSGGGDVFAAAAIYARLKEHKAKIIVKIDGWAASAATTIAMAGDEIEIANNALFMIHDPLFGLFGYYNAQDMAEMQTQLEVIKKGIINAYQLKTGKTAEEISDLMTNETWYTAQEAIDAGFIDRLMFESTANVAVNSAGAVSVNGVTIAAKNYAIPNKVLSLYQNHAGKDSNINKKNEATEQKGEEQMEDIKTKEELKEAYPDLVKEIEEEAREDERNRIKEIEEITEPGTEEIANKAKYETGERAGAVAIKILNAKKQQGAAYLAGRQKDINNSGMEGVQPEGNAGHAKGEEDNEYMDAIDKAYPKSK